MPDPETRFRGRPSRALLEERVRQAIWHRNESLWLDESPLAQLPSVLHLAQHPSYRQRFCPAGKALQTLIFEALRSGALDLDGGAAKLSNELSHPEGTLTNAAEAMGRTASHVCRRFRPVVVRHVLHCLVNSPGG
jgi:hypothetical protein